MMFSFFKLFNSRLCTLVAHRGKGTHQVQDKCSRFRPPAKKWIAGWYGLQARSRTWTLNTTPCLVLCVSQKTGINFIVFARFVHSVCVFQQILSKQDGVALVCVYKGFKTWYVPYEMKVKWYNTNIFLKLFLMINSAKKCHNANPINIST